MATLAAISWAFVYAFTQNILEGMSPLNLLTATYLFAGLVCLIPYFILGERQDIIEGLKENPIEFGVYILLIVLGKFFMIFSVNLVGAVAAGLVEISYVSGTP